MKYRSKEIKETEELWFTERKADYEPFSRWKNNRCRRFISGGFSLCRLFLPLDLIHFYQLLHRHIQCLGEPVSRFHAHLIDTPSIFDCFIIAIKDFCKISLALARAGIQTIEDLQETTRERIAKARSIGKKSMKELHEFLDAEGITLKDERKYNEYVS